MNVVTKAARRPVPRLCGKAAVTVLCLGYLPGQFRRLEEAMHGGPVRLRYADKNRRGAVDFGEVPCILSSWFLDHSLLAAARRHAAAGPGRRLFVARGLAAARRWLAELVA